MRLHDPLLSPLSIAAVLLSLTVAVSLLATHLAPATELTRLRNSMIAAPGTLPDFHWTPSNLPDDFRIEVLSAPPPIALWASGIEQPSGTVGLIEAMVSHLRQKPKMWGWLKSSTLVAYREIIETGRGDCADYTQVFNGLSHSLELPVREWGMSFDRFGGDGHAFSEVWDSRGRQWIFVDPMNGFYTRDPSTGQPLSVLQFRKRLLAPDAGTTIDIVPIDSKFRFDSEQDAFAYYREGADQFFLWFGNDVFTYYQSPLVKKLGKVSRSLEQLSAIAVGIHPKLKILVTQDNMQEIEELLTLPYRVAGLSLLVLALASLLGFQSICLWRSRSLTRQSTVIVSAPRNARCEVTPAKEGSKRL